MKKIQFFAQKPFLLGLFIIGLGLVGLRFYQIKIIPRNSAPVDLGNLTEEELKTVRAYLKLKKIKASIFPSGKPKYGDQLGVSYDQADQAVDILAQVENEVGLSNLSEKEKARYRKIATTPDTACKFCCGLKSFGNEAGERACGCAHNRALSGLTMWMIKNGYDDQEILTEIGKWRSLFFPKQTLSLKLQELKGKDSGAKEILKEFPEFLPEMVGGC